MKEIIETSHNIIKFLQCPPKSIKHLINNAMAKSKDTI
jgi:hypothetical protein